MFELGALPVGRLNGSIVGSLHEHQFELGGWFLHGLAGEHPFTGGAAREAVFAPGQQALGQDVEHLASVDVGRVEAEQGKEAANMRSVAPLAGGRPVDGNARVGEVSVK